MKSGNRRFHFSLKKKILNRQKRPFDQIQPKIFYMNEYQNIKPKIFHMNEYQNIKDVQCEVDGYFSNLFEISYDHTDYLLQDAASQIPRPRKKANGCKCIPDCRLEFCALLLERS